MTDPGIFSMLDVKTGFELRTIRAFPGSEDRLVAHEVKVQAVDG